MDHRRHLAIDTTHTFDSLQPSPASSESSPVDSTFTAAQQRQPDNPPQSVQVISTLIDSLGKIAASAFPSPTTGGETNIRISAKDYSRDSSVGPPDADVQDREQHDPPVTDDSSEGEAAAAPVIGYARRLPLQPKGSSRSFKYSIHMSSQQSLAASASAQSLQSRAGSDSVGMGTPSIERRDRSSVSSTFSFVSGMSGTQRKRISDSIYDQTGARSIPRRISSDRRHKTSSLYSNDHEKENKWPIRPPSADEINASSYDHTPAESPTTAALRLSSRSDLGAHMIPSRRSSMRRSVTGLSEPSQEQRNRLSATRKDFKDLNIDTELAEGDNSTVRRIRELQEAREKRQQEWRNEARKSERNAKRHTIAAPKILSSQRSGSYQTSRLSVTEVVVESPAESPALEMSATVSPNDLAEMPGFVPSTPRQDTHDAPPPNMPTVPSTPSSTPSRINSLYRPSMAQTKRNSSAFTVKPEAGFSEMKSISEEVEAFLGAPRFSQKIRHPRTGRTIAFSEAGDPNGFVVLCCVGMGLTRYLTAFYDELARTLRLRLIAPDRPGVGASSPLPESQCTPLNWVDDVAIICSQLEITRFSLLAHSAGAIYALATALKMPQYVRGRIHLLAPWIPPSQMPKGAAIGPDSQPIANLPFTHKILSVLPAQLLKVANSRFLTATSASVDTKPLKSKKNKQLENMDLNFGYPFEGVEEHEVLKAMDMTSLDGRPMTSASHKPKGVSCYQANNETLGIPPMPSAPISRMSSHRRTSSLTAKSPPPSIRPMSPRMSPEARLAMYNQTLTHRIWTLATQNANPAIDLLVCLERRRPIGFRYPEVTRSVVIHHGAKDTRVPIDNVRWLHSVMKRCELRILENEGHGLMASASAMSTVLGEISQEWDEWERIAQNKERKRSTAASTFSRGRSFHSRFVDASYRDSAPGVPS
jgi:pimeloyl-ACP methyl ester carboxylesterase